MIANTTTQLHQLHSNHVLHRPMRALIGSPFQRYWCQSCAPFRFVWMAFALMLLCAATARATETITKERWLVEPEERLNDDVIALGEKVRIEGVVDGDIVGAMNTFTLLGEVTGAIAIFCQRFDVQGVARRSVAVFSETFYVEGAIDGSVYAFCNSMELAPSAHLRRDCNVFVKNLSIFGTLHGDLTGQAGEVTIAGTIIGNVDIETGSLEIQPGAVIHGDLRYRSDDTAIISDGAKIDGRVVRLKSEDGESGLSGAVIAWKVYFLSAIFVFGMIVIILSPGRFTQAYQAITNDTARAVGYGLAFFGGGLLLSFFLIITIVGVPASFAVLSILTLLFLFANIYTAAALGHLALRKTLAESIWGRFARLAIGLAILGALTLIPYGLIVVQVTSAIIGAGGFILGLRSPQNSPSTAFSSAFPKGNSPLAVAE